MDRAHTQLEPTTSSRHLPIEVVIHILSYLCVQPPTSTHHPTHVLLLSSKLSAPLLPHVFAHIRLDTVHRVTAFASHLRQFPGRARLVRSLAVVPTTPHSDLYYALPSQGTSTGTPITSLVLNILRSCRRIRHVLFDGSLLGADLVRTYGTASQPRTVWCVNPRSFLPGFASPFFAKTTRVVLVDNSLTDEEVAEIDRMRGKSITTQSFQGPRACLTPPMYFTLLALRHFTWLIPKHNLDASRDARILLRLAGAQVQQERLRVSIAGNAPPPLPAREIVPIRKGTRDRSLRSVHVRTTGAQRTLLVDPLQRLVRNATEAAQAAIVEGNPSAADSVPTISSLGSFRTSTAIASATLCPFVGSRDVQLEASLVEPSFVRDWEDLRDAVCTPPSRTTGSTSVFADYGGIYGSRETSNVGTRVGTTRDTGEDEAGEEGEDGGRALRALLDEWESWLRTSAADQDAE